MMKYNCTLGRGVGADEPDRAGFKEGARMLEFPFMLVDSIWKLLAGGDLGK